MTSYEDVLRALTRAIWGYVFLCFNINLNTGYGIINFLPTFIGYCLFISVIDLLKNSVKEISLLRIPLIILIVWSIVNDILSILDANAGTYLPIISLVVDILNMYFNFQFLTNLAYIAKRCQYESCTFDKSLKFFRTVQTLLLTVIAILNILCRFIDLLMDAYIYVSLALALVTAINSFCIIVTLSRLKKNLIKPDEILPLDEPFSGTVPTNEGDVPPIAPPTDFNEATSTPKNQKPLADIE